MSFDSAWKSALRNRRRDNGDTHVGSGNGLHHHHASHLSSGQTPVLTERDERAIRRSVHALRRTPSPGMLSDGLQQDGLTNHRHADGGRDVHSHLKREHASSTRDNRRLRDWRNGAASAGEVLENAPPQRDQSSSNEMELEVDPIGEFSVTSLLPSLSVTGPRTTVRFEYRGEDEIYLLCWIDSAGNRHHSYEHKGTDWTHQEVTNAGHAFALFRKRDDQFIVSYRIIAALSEGQIHVVSLPAFRARVANIIVEARVIAELPFVPEFPSDREWTVTYSFSVPPLPQSSKPDFFRTNTIYVWGDLSFDEFPFYETEEEMRMLTPIHAYKMNQIVPQVMCGECLCASDPKTYVPSWQTFPTWVAQAQHYFQTEEGEERGSRAVCGPYFHVSPGERMRSTIQFTGAEMIIRIASEDNPENYSEIVSDNPFPNDTSIFPGGWAQFFSMKERVLTKTFRAYPCFNIEYKAQDADLDILESLCPFRIHDAKFPGFYVDNAQSLKDIWNIRGMNFFAKNGPMVEFG